ncbi:hypothetical protein D3C79_547620 [compost metagenome]
MGDYRRAVKELPLWQFDLLLKNLRKAMKKAIERGQNARTGEFRFTKCEFGSPTTPLSRYLNQIGKSGSEDRHTRPRIAQLLGWRPLTR